MGEIKNMLVAATAAGEEVRPLLADPDLDPKTKLLGNFSFALLSLVSIIVENGLMPLTGQGQADGCGPKAGPPPPPLKPSPGLRELKTCLENAETESYLTQIWVPPPLETARTCAPPSRPACGLWQLRMRSSRELTRQSRYVQ
jgi:hypothetical protein